MFSPSDLASFLRRIVQLEVMDTAGTEQFTALNEFYIKVRRRHEFLFPKPCYDFSRSPFSSSTVIHHRVYPFQQAGRGFILVFRFVLALGRASMLAFTQP